MLTAHTRPEGALGRTVKAHQVSAWWAFCWLGDVDVAEGTGISR